MKGFFVVAFASFVAITLALDCSKTIDRSGSGRTKFTVTYDLSPLVNEDQWIVKEKDLVDRNYTYHFNLCKPCQIPPTYGNPVSFCKNRTEEGGLFPAYQLSGGGDCYHLGGGVDNKYMRWTPIDYDDPSTGVTVQYTGGDSTWCGDNARSLRVSFYCMNNPSSLPNESSVTEYPQCTYNIRMESQYGCPVSCGEANRKLCGGNGVCGFDRDENMPRCFCNEGYYGNACENIGTGRSVMNSTSSILLCVCAFLVVVEIGVLIMWQKVKGLRLDPAAYANLNKESMGMTEI